MKNKKMFIFVIVLTSLFALVFSYIYFYRIKPLQPKNSLLDKNVSALVEIGSDSKVIGFGEVEPGSYIYGNSQGVVGFELNIGGERQRVVSKNFKSSGWYNPETGYYDIYGYVYTDTLSSGDKEKDKIIKNIFTSDVIKFNAGIAGEKNIKFDEPISAETLATLEINSVGKFVEFKLDGIMREESISLTGITTANTSLFGIPDTLMEELGANKEVTVFFETISSKITEDQMEKEFTVDKKPDQVEVF